jgi:hypothetical protein
MLGTRTELITRCRSLLQWAEENEAHMPRPLLLDLLILIEDLLECA